METLNAVWDAVWSIVPTIDDLWTSGAILWGIIYAALVAAISIASPRVALLISTFGLTYLARWSWGRTQLTMGENWARIDASFSYLAIDPATKQLALYQFPWEKDGRIQEWFKNSNQYLEMQIRRYATWATVDEPFVTFKHPVLKRRDWWIVKQFGRLMGWVRGTNAIGADGLPPTRTTEIDLYKELYGPLIKLITTPFRGAALQHASGVECDIVHIVLGLSWETYTPDKSRHWRLKLMLAPHLKQLETTLLPQDTPGAFMFSHARTLRIMGKEYAQAPQKFGVARIPVPKAFSATPEKLALYLAQHLGDAWMDDLLSAVRTPHVEYPRISRPKGRKIAPRV